MSLWQSLPIVPLLVEREMLFQAGLELHRGLVGDYELVPGRRLADTTVEERIALQGGWSEEMRTRRLARMGFDLGAAASAHAPNRTPAMPARDAANPASMSSA